MLNVDTTSEQLPTDKKDKQEKNNLKVKISISLTTTTTTMVMMTMYVCAVFFLRTVYLFNVIMLNYVSVLFCSRF